MAAVLRNFHPAQCAALIDTIQITRVLEKGGGATPISEAQSVALANLTYTMKSSLLITTSLARIQKMVKKLLLILIFFTLSGCASRDAWVISHEKPLVPVYPIKSATVEWNTNNNLPFRLSKLVYVGRSAPITEEDKYIARQQLIPLITAFNSTIKSKLTDQLALNNVTAGGSIIISLTPIAAEHDATTGKTCPNIIVLATIKDASDKTIWATKITTSSINKYGYDHFVDATITTLIETMKKDGWLTNTAAPAH